MSEHRLLEQARPNLLKRKQFHSINVEIVFDTDTKIIDVVMKWTGATHDSRIYLMKAD